MAADGVRVKALESMPELLQIDIFYLDMYCICGTSFNDINTYCDLYGLSKRETLEAVTIMLKVNKRVQ